MPCPPSSDRWWICVMERTHRAFAENALCGIGGASPSACQRPEIGGDVDVAWARRRASPYRPSSRPVRAQSSTAW